MLTLLEQIDKGNLWRSPGGIHPPETKALTSQSEIQTLPLAKEYWVPVPGLQDTCTLKFNIGDRVLKGEQLTAGINPQYLPVHAPCSGTITAVKEIRANHPSGLPVISCIIESDDTQQQTNFEPIDLDAADTDTILDRIRLSGVAGLGGAAFPTHIKLNPSSDIELVIINGVECEPYITADDRLMQEHANEIQSGIEIIHRLLQPKRIIIAIEDNKPNAIQAMQRAVQQSQLPKKAVRVTSIPTKYPSGGEKQLIQIITGQEVPSGAIPAQLGIVMQNVGTAFAIHQAVNVGKPLIERVVTVTGNGVKAPGNYWVPVGTPLPHLIEHCGIIEQGQQLHKVIAGGPMMGHMLPGIDVPVVKGSNCFLVPGPDEIATESSEQACIRCGECAQVCPARLLPQQLFWHSKAKEYDKASSYNLRDCIECGSCSYVCPSDIPLVEYYRKAKAAIKLQTEEKAAAEQAKIHFEARLKRLEAEKQEREAKAKKAAEKRQASMSGNDKDKVAEAMARIKNKQAKLKPVDSEPKTDKKQNVAAAIARAKAKKAKQAEHRPHKGLETASQPTETKSSEESNIDIQLNGSNDKKAKVAAAIARAKAKKAQSSGGIQTSQNNSITNTPAAFGEANTDEASSKQAKIAAAVARAKAKKAKNSAKTVPDAETTHTGSSALAEPVVTSNASDKSTDFEEKEHKKARIAAAVARAKAKKTAADTAQPKKQISQVDVEPEGDEIESDAQTELPHLDSESKQTNNIDKQARVAAAVAKAKAKKQQNQLDEHPHHGTTTVETEDAAKQSAEQRKKARIAAAVAKAKAKKVSSQIDNGDAES
ncbi:electron transport complex subunit RsxC [Shewanella gelidii]|uniref:Ion-translocating oxidoreductase complex subunit C n=1 Tax=Shewanella gelidii TaxID=1642821 RepID=A0A917NCT4_9GAMM|nr:electron transport complex subunit RsxC [Shewanella gelidii]MCL1097971.1 electron transport complex subunit RsxC [Shewanella gelidii]GGI85079.1 electron transport complex subunit C [Shewanella gelidii]